MSVREEIGPAKTAFVFAGGGSFGAIQVGMLHSLAAHGVAADMVVGSTIGALNDERRAVTLHCKSDRFIKAANYFFEPTSLP
ncbi:hypothetical protein [Bradyrhizobium sp. AZCC 1693]|uniref:hypothetical protein n=1 Tax=Bradyrhizobium sp. AZCC 1693 TaxID=3117029 RepID=UPI002FF18067